MTLGLALNDFSKLRVMGGVIRYRLYRQDGMMQDMTCADTQSNRLFVSWVQKFDRYTAQGIEAPSGGETLLSGSAEGESPVRAANAPSPSPIERVDEEARG